MMLATPHCVSTQFASGIMNNTFRYSFKETDFEFYLKLLLISSRFKLYNLNYVSYMVVVVHSSAATLILSLLLLSSRDRNKSE